MAEERRIAKPEKKMIDPCFPPYYPDEDRQLAAELLAVAAQLTDIASRVLQPDHYWKAPPPDQIMPMDDA